MAGHDEAHSSAAHDTTAIDVEVDQAFADGHECALRLAYDVHGTLVYNLCRRAVGAEQAKDVTQEVFVSAWRGRRQFDPGKGPLAAWLVGITRRRIIDHLRSEGRHADRRSHSEVESEAETAARSTTLHDVDGVADRLVVVDALQSLPSRPRHVIELAYVHDLTHNDIVERTGIPLGTVKSDIRRGLAKIRDHLESSHA